MALSMGDFKTTIVENRVHIRELHATILEHEKLTFRFPAGSQE